MAIFLNCLTLLINDRGASPIRVCAELIIDLAYNLELIIPWQKALQLHLEEEREATVLGWDDHSMKMMFYKDNISLDLRPGWRGSIQESRFHFYFKILGK